MKIEDGIRKSGYAMGFALAAGIAVAATLVVHARPARAESFGGGDCPIGDVCPPLCVPDTTCGPVDPATVTGYFVKQKANGMCVYQCQGDQTCTELDENCGISTFTNTDFFRRREPYPAGQCPMDAASATWICQNGLYEE